MQRAFHDGNLRTERAKIRARVFRNEDTPQIPSPQNLVADTQDQVPLDFGM